MAREAQHFAEPGRLVRVPAGSATLEGNLAIPEGAQGLVLFAHGSGSSRHSPRNRSVAGVLHDAGFATLLLDLLTTDEELVDARTAELRFDIPLLARRLDGATGAVKTVPDVHDLPVGYFGASTGAAAALLAAADRRDVDAIVSRGGRVDLAGPALRRVTAPTLLIVGEQDALVLDLNRAALNQLRSEARLEIVPGATHLFEEPGALEEVAGLARNWFERSLGAARTMRRVS